MPAKKTKSNSVTKNAKEGGFLISGLVKHVAKELRNVEPPEGEKAVLQLQECELEVAVSVKAEASGQVRFWVVDAHTKASAETISRVKLKFSSIPNNPTLASMNSDDEPPTADKLEGVNAYGK